MKNKLTPTERLERADRIWDFLDGVVMYGSFLMILFIVAACLYGAGQPINN